MLSDRMDQILIMKRGILQGLWRKKKCIHHFTAHDCVLFGPLLDPEVVVTQFVKLPSKYGAVPGDLPRRSTQVRVRAAQLKLSIKSPTHWTTEFNPPTIHIIVIKDWKTKSSQRQNVLFCRRQAPVWRARTEWVYNAVEVITYSSYYRFFKYQLWFLLHVS